MSYPEPAQHAPQQTLEDEVAAIGIPDATTAERFAAQAGPSVAEQLLTALSQSQDASVTETPIERDTFNDAAIGEPGQRIEFGIPEAPDGDALGGRVVECRACNGLGLIRGESFGANLRKRCPVCSGTGYRSEFELCELRRPTDENDALDALIACQAWYERNRTRNMLDVIELSRFKDTEPLERAKASDYLRKNGASKTDAKTDFKEVPNYQAYMARLTALEEEELRSHNSMSIARHRLESWQMIYRGAFGR